MDRGGFDLVTERRDGLKTLTATCKTCGAVIRLTTHDAIADKVLDKFLGAHRCQEET